MFLVFWCFKTLQFPFQRRFRSQAAEAQAAEPAGGSVPTWLAAVTAWQPDDPLVFGRTGGLSGFV